MPAITNDAMLIQILGDAMSRVIDDLKQDFVEIIKKSIEENVYNPYPEGPNYDRLYENGGFLGAWTADETKRFGNMITARVDMNPELLSPPGDGHHHGNPYVDRRNEMDRIIMEGTDWDIGGAARIPRDYWTFVEQWIETGQADWYLERAMTKHGICFQRIL